MVLFRVHGFFGKSQKGYTNGQSSLFSRVSQWGKQPHFPLLWMSFAPLVGSGDHVRGRPHVGRAIRPRRNTDRARGFLQQKPSHISYLLRDFSPLGLSYPAISRTWMTWSFPLWLEEKQVISESPSLPYSLKIIVWEMWKKDVAQAWLPPSR